MKHLISYEDFQLNESVADDVASKISKLLDRPVNATTTDNPNDISWISQEDIDVNGGKFYLHVTMHPYAKIDPEFWPVIIYTIECYTHSKNSAKPSFELISSTLEQRVNGNRKIGKPTPIKGSPTSTMKDIARQIEADYKKHSADQPEIKTYLK